MLEQIADQSCDYDSTSGVLRGVALALSGIKGATCCLPAGPDVAGTASITLPTNPPTLVTVPLGDDSDSYQYGFQATVHAVVDALACGGRKLKGVNILPGVVSAADVRCLTEMVAAFGLPSTALPDFAACADQGGAGLTTGGTAGADIARMGRAQATLEFGRIRYTPCTAGQLLREKYQLPWYRLPLPIGLASTDKCCKVLEKLTDRPVPKYYRLARRHLVETYEAERGQLSGRKVALYGEDSMVAALTAFLYEAGMEPVLCISEGKSGQLAKIVHYGTPDLLALTPVQEGIEFSRVAALVKRLAPQMLIGSPMLQPLALELGLPFIHAGFPFPERQPTYFGFTGTLQLFERMLELFN